VSADKLITLYGLLVKTEASYGAGGAVAAGTDGVLLMEPADMTIGYVHAGERGKAPGSGGQLKRGAQSGQFGETSFKVEGRGRGTAYGASALPELHALMRLSGHSATVDASIGAEKVTYAPVSAKADFASAVAEGYARGQKYPLTGIYGDFGFSIDGPGFIVFEFPISGLIGIPTDVSVPAITYIGADPPKAESIGLTIGAWSPVVRSLKFNANRKRSPRANVNNPGHQGFNMGGRAPQLEIVVEAAPLATFDPFTARKNATPYAVALEVGSTQYNRIGFTAAQAQIADVAEGADEDAALWTLTMPCSPTTPIANDDYQVEFS
jgi:hypothetical protein